MTVDRIELHDVMSHEKASVDLCGSLNVFTGASDSGKSAIVRALLFAMKNEPAGIDLLRHGAGRGSFAEIVLHCTGDDGKKFTVARRRGKSKNEYELDGRPLLAFGQSVPEQIERLFNLSQYAFQCQSDGSFLLSSTDGEVSKVLSRTVGLSEIDSAFVKIRSMKSKNDTALACAKMEAERFGKDGERYAGVDGAMKTLASLNPLAECLDNAKEMIECEKSIKEEYSRLPPDMLSSINSAEITVGGLMDARAGIDKANAALSSVSSLIASIKDVPVPVSTVRVSILLKEIAKASEMRDGAYGNEKRVRELLSQIRSLPEIADFSSADLSMRMIGETSAIYASKTEDLKKVSEIAASINECGEYEKKLDGEISTCEREIAEYKKTHRICPTCGAESCHWHKEVKEGM